MSWAVKTRAKPQYRSLPSVVEEISGLYGKKAGDEGFKPLIPELISEFVFSAAATHHTLDQEGSALSLLYQQLAEIQGHTEARVDMLEHIRAVTRTDVATPHPTQVLGNEGIKASLALNEAIFRHTADLREGTELSEAGKTEIKEAIKALESAIRQPVMKSLTIEEEMERDRMLSIRNMDALPIVVENILAAVNVGSSAILANSDLEYFSNLTRSMTWAAFDQDGKSSTPEQLQQAIELNAEEVRKRYIKMLEGLRDTLPDVSSESRQKLTDIMAKITPEGFNSQTLETDLKALRAIPEIQAIKNSPENGLTALDEIIVKVMNTGDTVSQGQIRQNRKMHEEAYRQVIAMLPEDQKPVPATIPEFLDRFLDKDKPAFAKLVTETVDAKLKAIRASVGGSVRKDAIYIAGHPQEGQEISKQDFGFYQTMESLGVAVRNPGKIPHVIIAEAGGIDDSNGKENDVLRGFALLKVMQELRAPEAKHNVAMIPLTEYPGRVRENGEGKVPCIEMVTEAMENKHFAEHYLSIQNSRNMLKDYTLEINKFMNEESDSLSYATAKRRYGIEPKEGDDQKMVKGLKIIMFAGSDMTRVAGQAGKPLVERVIEKFQEEMLDKHGILIIPYKGLGTGVARSNPSMADMATFSQGVGMERTTQQQAARIQELLLRRIEASIGNNLSDFQPEPLSREDRATLARLNMGNMAKLPLNPESWEAETKHRTEAMVDKHKVLFDSDEFNAMMSHTADPFVKAAAAFAARAAARSGDKSAEIFPPPLDVQEMRAIGYQAALNASGIASSLFYGTSTFLSPKNLKTGKDTDLRELYLTDPKFQSVVNTATYGVILADMDAAWKYQGFDKAPGKAELEKMAARTINAEEKADLTKQVKELDFRLLSLEAGARRAEGQSPEFQEMNRNLQDSLKNELEQLNQRVNEITQAQEEKALALIHLEYNRASNQLLKLHNSMLGKTTLKEMDGKDAAKALLATLPVALQQEYSISLKNIEQPRKDLAETFDRIVKGDLKPEDIKRGGKEYGAVYDKMAVVMRVIERVNAASQDPHWGLDIERQSRQMSLAKTG